MKIYAVLILNISEEQIWSSLLSEPSLFIKEDIITSTLLQEEEFELLPQPSSIESIENKKEVIVVTIKYCINNVQYELLNNLLIHKNVCDPIEYTIGELDCNDVIRILNLH